MTSNSLLCIRRNATIRAGNHGRMKSLLLLLGGLLSLSSASFGATIIFSDSFNRSGSLNGTATDVGGLTWTSSSNNSTTTADGGKTGGWNAKVAFTPVANQKYLLTITGGTAVNGALEFGFANDSGGFTAFNYLLQDVTNMQTAIIGSVNSYGSVVSGTRTHTGYAAVSPLGATLTLLMDTTNGLANTSFTYRINDNLIGAWTGNASSYNSVVFGRAGSTNPSNTSAIRDITLSAIPEPASALLGGLGLLLLLRRRRRKY